jgi:hypothetical protein
VQESRALEILQPTLDPSLQRNESEIGSSYRTSAIPKAEASKRIALLV